MQVWSLGREYPLEEEMATHSSTPARKTPRTEKPGQVQHDWACMHAPALAWKSFEERSPNWFIFASLHQAQNLKHSRPSANMCWIKGNNYVLPFTCVKPWAESRPYQKGIWPILQVRNQGEVICPKSTTSKWKAAFDFQNPDFKHSTLLLDQRVG